MAEVTERVLRWVKDGPLPSCPTCGQQVNGYEAETETEWVLKDEYAGTFGLPAGPEFGRQVPIRNRVRLQPCGDDVERVEFTVPPPPPSPLAAFKVSDDYNGGTTLEHDCGWSTEWDWRDRPTLAQIVTAATAHADRCDDLNR